MKKRLLAMLLVVAMVAGMVPAMSAASGKSENLEDILPNIITDSFTDDRYVNGTLYKWAEFNSSTNFTKELKSGGYYNLTNMYSSQSYKNFISNYLTATNVATGEDYAKNWSNYSVEMNYRVDAFNPVIEGNQTETNNLNVAKVKASMLVMGRVQHHADGTMTFYAAGFQYGEPDAEGNNGNVTKFFLYKCKRYDSSESNKVTFTSLGSASVAVALNTYHRVKLSFDDNKIEAYLDGECLVSAEDSDYTSGTIGYMVNRCGSMTINGIKLIHEDDVSTFVDDFSDRRYIDGAVVRWNADNEFTWEGTNGVLSNSAFGENPNSTPVDVNSKWNILDSATEDISRVLDTNTGMFTFTNENTSTSESNYVSTYLTLASQAGDQTANWKNYTVEAAVKLISALDKQTKLGIMGRVHLDADGNLVYYAAGIRYSMNTVYLYEGKITPSGSHTLKEIASTKNAISFEADKLYNVKMTFIGNNISVAVNGTDCINHLDEINAFTAGGVGVVMTRKGEAALDSIKVTDVYGKVLFTEDFTNGNRFSENGETGYVLGGAYHAGAFIAAEGSDSSADASATVPTVNLISINSGNVDYAQTWKDYVFETDFFLEDDESVAGLVARATNDGYYELRVTKNRISLWKVTATAEEELTGLAVDVSVGVWHNMKLAVSGSIIEANFDATDLFTYSNASDFAAGSVGVKALGNVKFDNFCVYDSAAIESRKYRTFKFKGTDVSQLTDWNLQADEWCIDTVTEIIPITFESVDTPVLSSKIASGAAKAVLTNKRALDDYYVEAAVILPASGDAGLIGRYSSDGSQYYMFRVDARNNIEIVKVVDGNETVLKSVSYISLYENGIKLQPEAEYLLRLQMYGNVIEGYIDGEMVLRATDAEAPLTKGTSGVFGCNGTAVKYLTLSPVDVVTSISIVNLIDAQGKPIWSRTEIDTILEANPNNPLAVRGIPVGTKDNPVEVFFGKVPDIKNMWLQVEYYDGTVGYYELDRSDIEAFDGSKTGDKQANVEYLNASTVFYYTVKNRPEDIAQIKQELAVLEIPTSKDSEAYINDLYDRFSDLSYDELLASGIPAADIKKLYDSVDAIDLMFSPELEGTTVLFRDTFDTSASESKYDSEPAYLTWRRSLGTWYVENGTMYEYNSEDHSYPVRFASSAVVVDENGKPENWEIRSVSVDVQFISSITRAGIDFCFGGIHEERYNLNITDKDHRVTLNKNNTQFGQAYALDDYGVEFVPGVWYNIRVTLDGNGLIRCYVNGRLWFHYQDTPTVADDQILTHGSVALYASENHARFDNLVVRGVGAGADFDEDYYNTITPDEIGGTDEYLDNFDDETAGQSPSHWIELNTEDKWLVKDNGGNKVYALDDNTKTNSHTWLHVFETNVDFAAKVKVTDKGYLPVVALSSRVNADESYIRAGYDFTLQKWYISVRMGVDFEPVITYSDIDIAAAQKFLTDGVTLRTRLVNKEIELYADGVKVLTADADLKVMPGRVGVFANHCDVEVDDVVLKLLSGQGRVNDGVLEYYTNTVSRFHSILEMWDDDGNQILLLYEDGIQSISMDGGQTFTRSTMYSDNGFPGNSSLELHDGTYINIKRRGGSDPSIANERWVRYSTDGGKTWNHVGKVCLRPFASYAQPAEHINEVRLNETTWRVFYTLVCGDTGHSETFYTDYVEGMDNFGEVWHASLNTPSDFVNIDGWNESYVIQISKDTYDRNGNFIEAGTLIQYSSHNSSNTMRYTLSYDGGVTWVGDYVMPEIVCGDNSCCIKEDPYEPGTYYMVAPYNLNAGPGHNHPRFRVVLLRSYDGMNWEFLADVDRWGQITDRNHSNIMQQVNAYLCITEDYVFPTFARSDQILADASNSHHKQIGRMYRFEKDKLDAYDVWPTEYYVPDKTITYIELELENERVDLNDPNLLTGGKIKVNYFNAESEYVDLVEAMDMTQNIDQPRAFVKLPDISTPGIKPIVLDYRHFRTIAYVSFGLGDEPVISGVENGKIYCSSKEVYVGDANGDIESVTVNGVLVTPKDGKFMVYPEAGTQTIVVTDAKGNSDTVTITINDGHTWSDTYTCDNGRHWKTCTVEGCTSTSAKYACSGGKATCTELAKCSTCGGTYGKLAEHELENGKCACGYTDPTAPGYTNNSNFFTMLINAIVEFFKKILALIGLA